MVTRFKHWFYLGVAYLEVLNELKMLALEKTGIGFDTCGQNSLADGSLGKNVSIFGIVMSSFVHIDNDNKGKYILILGKRPT